MAATVTASRTTTLSFGTKAEAVISIVLPARNEERTIGRAISAVGEVLASGGIPYEIIVGDSASDDGTAATALAAGDAHVRIVRLGQPGKGRILSRCLSAARGSIVGFIDSDLEISAEYLRPAIIAVLLGADAAIGTKMAEPTPGRGLARRGTTALANRLIRASLGTRISDHQAGMKVFRRDAVMPLLPRVRTLHWLWDTELLALLHGTGARIQEIPIVTNAGRPSRFGSINQMSVAALELVALCGRLQVGRWQTCMGAHTREHTLHAAG